MANTSLGVLNALGVPINIDMEQIPGGDLRQVVTLGGKSLEAAVAEVVNSAVAAGLYGVLTRRAPVGAPFVHIATASNNATSVATGARQIHAISGFNNSQGVLFVKVYDKASPPNPATDTPVWVIGSQPGGPPWCEAPPPGVAFTLGIAILIVQGSAHTDNTGVAVAGTCVVNIFKE